MKYKKFTEQKPPSDGEYWYKMNADNEPRLAVWDSERQTFKGDADNFGYHSFVDPELWCEVELPEL